METNGGRNIDAIVVHFGNEEHTTAHHLVRALRRTVGVVEAGAGHPSTEIPPHLPILWVESGRPSLPTIDDLQGRRTAAWLIDTHRDLSWRLSLARAFDIVFVAQRAAVDPLRAAGIDARWLPLAFPDDLVHETQPPRKTHVDFVGNIAPGSQRERILGPILDEYAIPLGYEPPERMLDRYRRAKIVVNVPLNHDLNMRAFEAVGCGAHLVTGPMDGIEEILPRHGYSVVTEEDGSAWLDAVRRLLEDEESLRLSAEEAQHTIIERHTYGHRANAILEVFARTVAAEHTTTVAGALTEAARALGLPGLVWSNRQASPDAGRALATATWIWSKRVGRRILDRHRP